MVAYTPTTTPGPEKSSPSIPSGPIAAVVLLLPPHARPCWSESLLAWRTGFLPGLLKLGLRGFWRAVLVFEGNVGNMIAKGLKDADIEGGNEVNLVFVQACCRNPEWEGESGPGRKLLDWGIRRRWQRDRKIPVWLDCFSDDAEAAYKQIGFKLLGDCMVDTGCDSKGIKLKTDAGEKEREEGKRVAKQRVMVRIPET